MNLEHALTYPSYDEAEQDSPVKLQRINHYV
jgi:hypothetical protein